MITSVEIYPHGSRSGSHRYTYTCQLPSSVCHITSLKSLVVNRGRAEVSMDPLGGCPYMAAAAAAGQAHIHLAPLLPATVSGLTSLEDLQLEDVPTKGKGLTPLNCLTGLRSLRLGRDKYHPAQLLQLANVLSHLTRLQLLVTPSQQISYLQPILPHLGCLKELLLDGFTDQSDMGSTHPEHDPPGVAPYHGYGGFGGGRGRHGHARGHGGRSGGVRQAPKPASYSLTVSDVYHLTQLTSLTLHVPSMPEYHIQRAGEGSGSDFWLGGLTALKRLTIQGQRQGLSSVTGVMGYPHLIGQSLALNQTHLIQSLTRLTCLEQLMLDLEQGPNGRLPAGLSALTRLTHLQVNYNGMLSANGRESPGMLNAVSACSNLHGLELSGCSTAELPTTLCQLSHLSYLQLGIARATTNMVTLPHRLFEGLGQLKELHLVSNGLSMLPPSLTCLTSLERLQAAGNGLMGLPRELDHLCSLRYLNLADNHLGRGSGLKLSMLSGSYLQQLTALNCQNTQLTKVPEDVSNLTNLRNLRLDHNKLSSLPRGMSALVRLTSINLAHNQLKELPSWIGAWVQLQELNVEGQRSPQGSRSGLGRQLLFSGVKDVPNGLLNLRNLRTMSIDVCPAVMSLVLEAMKLKGVKVVEEPGHDEGVGSNRLVPPTDYEYYGGHESDDWEYEDRLYQQGIQHPALRAAVNAYGLYEYDM